MLLVVVVCVVCAVCCVVCGVWCVVGGGWCVVCGVWCVVCGVWCVVCAVWCVVCGVCVCVRVWACRDYKGWPGEAQGWLPCTQHACTVMRCACVLHVGGWC